MDNLINFDENIAKNVGPEQTNSQKWQALIPLRTSVDLSNPFEKAEFHATNAGDPFECLEFPAIEDNDTSLHLQDGSL